MREPYVSMLQTIYRELPWLIIFGVPVRDLVWPARKTRGKPLGNTAASSILAVWFLLTLWWGIIDSGFIMARDPERADFAVIPVAGWLAGVVGLFPALALRWMLWRHRKQRPFSGTTAPEREEERSAIPASAVPQ